MYKFVLYVLLAVFQVWMMAVQLDEERSLHMLFELKHGVNRSAHAAAQQLDEEELAFGRIVIDEAKARETALQYLQANLKLDALNRPAAGSQLRAPVQLLVLDVINGDRSFPYRYVNEEYDYEVEMSRPGVVMIIRAEYPRIYRAIEPIVWTVKGTAQLYPIMLE